MNVRAALSLAAMASLCGCGGATTTGSGGVEKVKTVEKQVAQQAVSRM